MPNRVEVENIEMIERNINKKRTLKTIFLTISLLSIAIQVNGQSTNEALRKNLKVLFIGNSLTYANGLPEVIKAFAKAEKKGKFDFKMVAEPNFALEDHWNRGVARKLIEKEKWDYVILQQGPSASADGRQMLLEYSARFAEIIKRYGGIPALYMVWPSVERTKDFAGVRRSYQEASNAVGGIFLPVGEAWLEAWKLDETINLHAVDGFHPTPLGTYLAALVIFQKLFARAPIAMPGNVQLGTGEKISVSKKQLDILHKAAFETNRKYADEPE